MSKHFTVRIKQRIVQVEEVISSTTHEAALAICCMIVQETHLMDNIR